MPDLWGDYGPILVAGFSVDDRDAEGRLQLRRTGPYVPPAAFSLSRFLIVTDACRSSLEREFPDLEFRPVVKRQIVDLHWETWDRTAEPKEWPDDGEPESYILHGQHSGECSRAMGDLWEVVLKEGIRSKTSRHPAPYELTVDPTTWNGLHFLRSTPNVIPVCLVTEVGKRWLIDHSPEGCSFRETTLGTVEPKVPRSP